MQPFFSWEHGNHPWDAWKPPVGRMETTRGTHGNHPWDAWKPPVGRMETTSGMHGDHILETCAVFKNIHHILFFYY